MTALGSRKAKTTACKELTMPPQGEFARTKAFRVLIFARSDCLGVVDDLTKPALGPTRSEVSKAKRLTALEPLTCWVFSYNIASQGTNRGFWLREWRDVKPSSSSSYSQEPLIRS